MVIFFQAMKKKIYIILRINSWNYLVIRISKVNASRGLDMQISPTVKRQFFLTLASCWA